jgi:broad specificity phosphatase PhoE
MYVHLNDGAEMSCMSRTLPTLFRNANNYRRQLTITPTGVIVEETSDDPHLTEVIRQQIVVLPGLREIEAGAFEGQPERDAFTGYFQPLEQWLRGNRFVRIPGSIDANEFDARFDEAVDAIYRSGQQQPVAFWHGAAIAMWTMMNVANPPLDLAQSQPLPNTGYVVVRGNPQDGWTLLDWNGTSSTS